MNIFITGANRGLGLGFVQHYANRGDNIIAGCRIPERAVELKELVPKEHILRIDVADPGSISEAASRVRELVNRLDILINNAGVGEDTSAELPSFDDLIRTYSTNAIGPVLLTKQLKTHLGKGSKVVNVTSRMGSITDNTSGGYYDYRMSKAALNMATKNLHLELAGDGVVVFAIHPGWVRTDMGGASALLSIEESVSGMVQVIDTAGIDDGGSFLGYDGSEIPW